ncbi:2-oxoglutarate dehydrogenase, E2 component, dihydrolipoamide succinyltransferase [Amycolatopsis acidicola]|uniref:Dihydrolipoamide acetyltransferase component of pyruvate dehydrogenase complex n=1 Tax=Amycolatopsis acidicola TaxID=2596893 RepID=A0A5N0UW41_9PSEU|nr:2-oxoglutarate dehydrogenase, E2 component, dihydrolipoamide succinyltransferase [Amycolatopsis acidicola]KAA9154424.1 2-oxoglutarate dehydrogenase, E2 component, dihydrolipoamide succinyltransferase [Amycolatopsis acidicola]
MAYSVTLPELGESVTEGTVTRWLKQEGDSVAVDEPLLEISTDKVDTEVPSPVAGVVARIVAKEDDTVEVGGELAVIDDGSGGGEAAAPAQESKPEPAPEPAQQEAPAAPAAEEPAPAAQPASGGGSASGTPVTLPELGESVTEGTVTRWLKQVGDSVEVDEPLLEISTDKVDTEVPSPVAGTVLEISVAEDETVEVGGQLAVIGDASAAPAKQAPAPEPEPQKAPEPAPAPVQETKPAPAAPPAPPAPKPAAPAPQAPAPAAAQADGDGSGPYVTPLVRKLATEHGIDLASLTGSGVGGRIRKQDVLAAAEAKQKQQPAAAAPSAPAQQQRPSAPAPAASPELAALRGTVQKASRIRQVIAQRTRESLQTSAQLTQVFEVDVTKVARLRQQAKGAFQEREGVKLTFLPFFAKATVEALKAHPNINAYLNEETKEITYFGEEHLAVAVDTERGLVSPVIHNAGGLNLAGLAQAIADVANRTRTNKIKPDELSGGTFTVTNLGSNGALFDTPIINQPQSGILGVGAVVKRPVVVTDAEGQDTIAIRSMAYLALTYDHRLIDGADAGRFLTTIKNRLEEGHFEDELGL